MSITAHMVVKNEDQWIYYAILSTLPYVSEYLIADTGSSDHTLEIIQSIKSPKIKLTKMNTDDPNDISEIRQSQLEETKSDWLWIIDGDEVYPTSTANEISKAVSSGKFEGVVVRRYDLVGDIYHAVDERIGEYQLFGHRGHLLTRLLNKKKIQGLHVEGTYPLEGYYDKNDTSIRERNKNNYYITDNRLFHSMYLKRSSLGANLVLSLNRSKYKIELGKRIPLSEIPEVFRKHPPINIPDLTKPRSWLFEFLAFLITPIKSLKRRLL